MRSIRYRLQSQSQRYVGSKRFSRLFLSSSSQKDVQATGILISMINDAKTPFGIITNIEGEKDNALFWKCQIAKLDDATKATLVETIDKRLSELQSRDDSIMFGSAFLFFVFSPYGLLVPIVLYGTAVVIRSLVYPKYYQPQITKLKLQIINTMSDTTGRKTTNEKQ